MRANKKALFLTLILLSVVLQPFLAISKPKGPKGKANPGGMEQVLFGGYRSTLDFFSTEYNSLVGGTAWTFADLLVYKLVSTDGVIKNLRVKLSIAPGAGTHFDFTLMVNGAPSALTLEIANAATSGNDMVHEIDVIGGDTVSLQCAPDNFPAEDVYATWTTVFEGDTAKESLILGGSDSFMDNSAITYCQVMCATTAFTNVENNFRQVVPTAGTIKNLYVKLTDDPGVAPDAFRFTLRKGGVSQTLMVTITADDMTGSDLVNSFAVVAGDVLTMMIEPLNGPEATPLVAWGMTFLADTDGESIVLGGSSDDLDAAATEYDWLTSVDTSVWNVNETRRLQLGQVCTLKKLYILLSGSPGAGNKYDFTLRIAGADSNVVATVSDAATTGNSGALEDTVALDDYLDLQVVPTDTPTVRDAYWGFVCYIAPPIPEFVENEGIIASDSTVDDEQWFFLNASIEIQPDTSTFLFNRIDIDPAGLNMSCSYTNATDTFVEENDPNNYLQLDVIISLKNNPNNTFVRIDYYLRIHSNVTKEGEYNIIVYSTASGGLNDTDTYTSVFILTMRSPTAPTKLFGAGFNASSPYVELHWTHNLLLFTIFEIQDSANGVDWDYLGQNNTAEYTDVTVSNGTMRYYKVRACRNVGVGWKNSTFTDMNFEKVYFVAEVSKAADVFNVFTGSSGIFGILLCIIVPIVAYVVKKG